MRFQDYSTTLGIAANTCVRLSGQARENLKQWRSGDI